MTHHVHVKMTHLWCEYSRTRPFAKAPPAAPTLPDSEITLLKEKHHKERAALHTRLGSHPRCILNIARHCLELQQREEMRQATAQSKETPALRQLMSADI